ncbi:hypothetical protein IF2G_05595 [Cordyceps javanica]|nr:hypothetical protein IF2G_05595 [Cordyceps javanica]
MGGSHSLVRTGLQASRYGVPALILREIFIVWQLSMLISSTDYLLVLVNHLAAYWYT